MASVFKMDPVMATLPQASLGKINLDVYPNARKEQAENYEARVEGMRNSIAIDGLIAPPCLAVYGEGFAAVAGFTRLLALLQLAIKPLADKANEITAADGTVTHKKSDDPTFININKASDRKRLRDLDPAAYDKVLMETTVPYTPKTVENKQEARIINGIENLVRNDMSPRETANMFLEILTDKESPVKAKSLAKRFDMSEGKISQYRKMAEFEKYLPTFLSTPATLPDGSVEKFTEDQLAQLKTTVNTLMTDYLNRLSMNPTKEEKRNKEAGQAIQFQHAREFINRIQPAANKTPLSRAVALTVFKKLLGWNETTGTLPDDRQTPDFTMFQQQIDNAVKAAGQVEAAAAEATAPAVDTAAVTGANPAAVPAATAGTGTSAGTVPSVTSPNVTQTPVTTTVSTAAGQQAEAVVANATAGAGAEVDTEGEETSMDDILDQGGDIAGAAADGTPGTRQVKANVAPPVAKDKYAKAKQHIEMDKYCDILLGLAKDPSNRVCDTASYLGSMSGIYESLGLDAERKEIDRALDGFSDSIESYIEKLEEVLEYAKKAGLPIKGINLKELVRPTFEVETEDESVPASV